MKVAIATQDLARVDAHFGWARHLMIYEVSAEGYHLVRTVRFDTGLAQDGDHSKLAPRLKALKGCTLVFVADVGPDGERELAHHQIAPLRHFAGEPVAHVLDKLVDGIRLNPPPWIRQAQQRYRRGVVE